ncbi:hypothetical protein JXO52_11325 [bacterium]|nr:hypothetical protein [bacterium]
MTLTETKARTVLRTYRTLDSWFISRYAMNLYRGCAHNCAYCDGRYEGYYLPGIFGEDVTVKINAADVLRRELDPSRRRTPLTPCYLMLGGGVGDSYQPAERTRGLTRQVLEIMLEYGLPVHLLTKSVLAARDMDLLSRISRSAGVLVTVSFSTLDSGLSALFEPGASPPEERIDLLDRLKTASIPCGMALMPVIPFLTDTPAHIETAVRTAAHMRLDYVLFSGMTLKPGRQMEHFLNLLGRHFPGKIEEYYAIYHGTRRGEACSAYSDHIHSLFRDAVTRYRMPPRIPAHLFSRVLTLTDLAAVMLDQIHYLCRLHNRPSSFGAAARAVAGLREPLPTLAGRLRSINGIGPVTEKVLCEILESRTSSYYRRLLSARFS